MRMRTLRSIIACVFMGLTSYLGSVTLQLMFLWTIKAFPKLWRKYIDIIMFMWISTAVWLMEWIVGIKFRLFGDIIEERDRAIFIMNHRTRLDWLYFYGVLMRYGWSVCHEKIVLKDELKRIPGPGWAMQCANYMFLCRNFQRDKFYLSNMLEYFCSLGHKTKILLFPEGSDFSEYSINKSNEYATKNGLQIYEQVLHPHTAGFVHLVLEAIRCSKANGEELDAIYDVTVAYADQEFATNELEFMFGKAASEVHFLCRRYLLRDILDDMNSSEEIKTENLKNFIENKWQEKERALVGYYEQTYAGDNCRRMFNTKERCLKTFVFRQWLSVLFMFGNIVISAASIILIPKISLSIFLMSTIIFVSMDYLEDGIDNLAMRLALKDKYIDIKHPKKNI